MTYQEESLPIELLENSFKKIEPQGSAFAASFYENLFSMYPEAKSLFAHTNMEEQQEKLLRSLKLIILNLRYPQDLAQDLQALGARHVQYGTLPEHYPLVGDALIKTLEQYLGNQWTPQLEKAWRQAYEMITKIMLEGAGELPEDNSNDGQTIEESTKTESTKLNVELLEESFAKVKPQADAFAASFYDNLFSMYPDAKSLFVNTNMAEQQKKLISSLVLVVENLRKPDTLKESLRGLGARHVNYGVLPEHYPWVGHALLKTFEQYLGNDWTPEVEKAWSDAFGMITDVMLEGADYSDESVKLASSSSKRTTVSSSGNLNKSLIATIIVGGGILILLLLLIL